MNEQLTFRQQRAVESLIVSSSIRSAAKHAQIGERSLFRWLQEDEFQSAVRHARQLSLTQLATHMQHMADRAIGTISQVMQDKKASTASRVSAARYSMEMYYKASTLEDIMERLRTIDKRLKAEARNCGVFQIKCPAAGSRQNQQWDDNQQGPALLPVLHREAAMRTFLQRGELARIGAARHLRSGL